MTGMCAYPIWMRRIRLLRILLNLFMKKLDKSKLSMLQNKNVTILFETSRLQLRRIEESDRELFQRLFCDSDMMKYLGGTWTVELAVETLHEWRDEWGKNNYYYGVIGLKSSNEVVGIAGFTEDTNPQEPGLEFSWFVLPEHQKKGYASEITRALLEFVFDVLKKDRLFAETHPDNAASNHVLKKLGFKNAGGRNHHYESLPGFDCQVLWEYTSLDWKNQ
ncbi:MAG: hypothetical protein C0410_01455 [Anaerolinea sp.]|nr:hypothetical protein [Anaerolinea sp.]